MLIFVFFILGSLLLTLQCSLFQFFPDWLGQPDLLFVLLLFLATRTNIYQGGVLALLFGLLMDTFAGVYLGIYTILYLVFVLGLKGLSSQLMLNDQSYQAPLVAVCYLLLNIGVVLFSLILAPSNDLVWGWGKVLLQMLILSVITVPLFHFFDLLLGRLAKGPVRLGMQQSQPFNRFR